MLWCSAKAAVSNGAVEFVMDLWGCFSWCLCQRTVFSFIPRAVRTRMMRNFRFLTCASVNNSARPTLSGRVKRT